MSEFVYSIFKFTAYLIIGIGLCYAGKRIRARFPQWKTADAGILSGGNLALALSSGGYYLAILLSLGGPISWASDSLWLGLLEAVVFGALAVLLLNASHLIAEKTYMSSWNLARGLKNGSVECGLVEAAHYVALGLMILGASWGDAGGPGIMLYFWLLGQVFLALALAGYLRIFRLDIQGELGRGNFPAALSIAGGIIAFGNLVRTAISGPFLGFARSTLESTGYFGFGFAALLGARWLADAWLFPKATFNDEIYKHAPPNKAAGIIDALVFIGVSILLGWVIG
ncbi:MAG: hypothetical protein A2234_04920 [Elusimicrobia bacterium RIFOXYA2_FULL_58_8]|nr:MAG: hypothetical protein A2285_01015 [Elusimicrobia bacterium RIFOXYA12_FULL_57_11]OGS16572.1 MAG: hypothetical protein A2234_04920 [Elusimicrobia bacterium RIFOXYA2_FULL_58_8]